jgi:hypothetical protein
MMQPFRTAVHYPPESIRMTEEYNMPEYGWSDPLSHLCFLHLHQAGRPGAGDRREGKGSDSDSDPDAFFERRVMKPLPVGPPARLLPWALVPVTVCLILSTMMVTWQPTYVITGCLWAAS